MKTVYAYPDKEIEGYEPEGEKDLGEDFALPFFGIAFYPTPFSFMSTVFGDNRRDGLAP